MEQNDNTYETQKVPDTEYAVGIRGFLLLVFLAFL